MAGTTQDQQLNTIIIYAAVVVLMVVVVIVVIKLLQAAPWLLAIAAVGLAGYVISQNYDNTNVEVMKQVIDREFQGQEDVVVMVMGVPEATLKKLSSDRPITFVPVSDNDFTPQKAAELAKEKGRNVVGMRFAISQNERYNYARVTVLPLGSRVWHVWQVDYDPQRATWGQARPV